MTYSIDFESVQDPAQKNYNIHFIAESDPGAQSDVPDSKLVLATIESALGVLDLVPVAAKCATNDGEFNSAIYIDDDPVPMAELIAAYQRVERIDDTFLAGGYGVELYRRADGRWAWRMVARNGNIVATDGGQGYSNRANAAEMVYNLFDAVPVVVTTPDGDHYISRAAKFNAIGELIVDGEDG